MEKNNRMPNRRAASEKRVRRARETQARIFLHIGKPRPLGVDSLPVIGEMICLLE